MLRHVAIMQEIFLRLKTKVLSETQWYAQTHILSKMRFKETHIQLVVLGRYL